MSQRIDLSGQRFGRLTVIRYDHTGKYGKAWWLCECDCGNKDVITLGESLKQGKTISCGCYRSDLLSKHRQSFSRIYRIYTGIVYRCKPNHRKYYGMRGIRLCEEWSGENGYTNFYKWSMEHGYSDDLSIDRIDVNGDYSPNNCRWASVEQQSYNKRNTVYVKYDGEYISLLELSKKTGIPKQTLYNRIHNKNKTVEEAVKMGIGKIKKFIN